MLVVEELQKAFGGVRAVDGVSWTLDAGAPHCIIGPNGAGKSTFFNLLIGQIRPDSGRIIFRGRDITRTHPFQRARLGIAVKPQATGVYPALTVEHNLRVALQWFVRRDELDRALDRHLDDLNLREKRGYLVSELAHGEKQWLGLGMAIAQDPSLLLLDEPTAGMSPTETTRTAEIIAQLIRPDRAIIVIEHDMAFVRELGADLTVLHDGQVFASGSLSDIEGNEEVRRLYLGRSGAAQLRGKASGESLRQERRMDHAED